jgi:hypothetical protein
MARRWGVRIGGWAQDAGQQKTKCLVQLELLKRPVQFELVEPARKTLLGWLDRRGGTLNVFVFVVK